MRMVSVNPNPQSQGFFFDSSGNTLPGINSLPAAPAVPQPSTVPNMSLNNNTAACSGEDPSKKIRKPYTITKSRESWSEQEHDKFLEALQLFDRDWKKIEAYVGSKTVIQIRSHAQKYFLKVQKSGSNERVPPPRPKRKAAHPYPQKAAKNAAVVSHAAAYHATYDPGYLYCSDSSLLLNSRASVPAVSWTYGSVPSVSSSNTRSDEAAVMVPLMTSNCCSSTNESTLPTDKAFDQGNQVGSVKVMPDFAQVYSFLGSVFDPAATGHLQKLKKMDPINIETVLLLMRNLSVNLTSPDFEDHRRLLSSYDVETGKARSCSSRVEAYDNSKTAIPAV